MKKIITIIVAIGLSVMCGGLWLMLINEIPPSLTPKCMFNYGYMIVVTGIFIFIFKVALDETSY